jgi:S-adenosylmethionine decarboxylase
MHGVHLTANLHGCRCDMRWFTDAQTLDALCLEAVAASGLRAVGQLFHAFPATARGPGGVTAAVLLAESHLCIHTWPELRGAALDVYVCSAPQFVRTVTRIGITRYGYAMAIPTPGRLRQLGAPARVAAGRLAFAHADWSGYSIFEEAFTCGHMAA